MADKIKELQNRINTLTAVISRANLAARLGMQYGGDRDVYQALGYPTDIRPEEIQIRYFRQDIAKAIIDKPVQTTWRGGFELIESTEAENTALENEWARLRERLSILPKFSRLDKLVGMGQYAVLLLGLDDVKTRLDFARPVSPGKRKLLYIRPLSQPSAEIVEWEGATDSPRYGKPTIYSIKMTNPGENSTTLLRVHYTRVLHVADELLESETEGISRLQAVYNRLMDLEKLVGGSAEMFWRGARPGYQGKLDPDYTMNDDAKMALQEQIDEYENNLRRMLINEGISLEALEQQVVDPAQHVDVQIQMISAVTGIPKRILTGSERGELASSQDIDSWHAVIESRRAEFAEPVIVRPFIDRLIELGVLPPAKRQEDGYSIQWASLHEQSDKDKAEVGQIRAQALAQYSSQPDAQFIVPPEAFYRFFLGFNEDQILLITEIQEAAVLEEEEEQREADESTE